MRRILITESEGLHQAISAREENSKKNSWWRTPLLLYFILVAWSFMISLFLFPQSLVCLKLLLNKPNTKKRGYFARDSRWPSKVGLGVRGVINYCQAGKRRKKVREREKQVKKTKRRVLYNNNSRGSSVDPFLFSMGGSLWRVKQQEKSLTKQPNRREMPWSEDQSNHE